MFKLFVDARPDERTLTTKFGVRPPAMYVRFTQWVYDRCGGKVEPAERLYYDLTGQGGSLNMLYPGTPVELFAVGSSGGDGSHAGFVVMTPERPADDYPWMDYAPAGHVLDLVAPDTPTFFTQLLSYAMAAQEEEEEDYASRAADAAEAAAWLGVNASAHAGRALGFLGTPKWWEIGAPKPSYAPPVPAGWRYEPVKDDVGVLAPAAAFAPRYPDEVARGKDLDLLLEEADRLLTAGFPATALRLLRTPLALWESQARRYDDFVDYTRQAYHALGRPALAARVGETV